MNQKFLQRLWPVLMIVLVAGPVLSQSKPGCDPKSCGPANTKVGEAKVITELRSELQNVIETMKHAPISFDKSVTTFEIGEGSSDDESVLFISQAAAFVRHELITKIPSGSLLPELQTFKAVPASTKQELIANLKKEVQLLVLQSQKI